MASLPNWILRKIEMENYRVFKDRTSFDLSPLTIITGQNSSGKSSIAKALLLLQENLKISKLQVLDFTTGKHSLGSFRSIANEVNKPVSFLLQYEPEEDENSSYWSHRNITALKVQYSFVEGAGKEGYLDALEIHVTSKEGEDISILKTYKSQEDRVLILDFNFNYFEALLDFNKLPSKAKYKLIFFPLRKNITQELFDGYTDRAIEVLKGNYESKISTLGNSENDEALIHRATEIVEDEIEGKKRILEEEIQNWQKEKAQKKEEEEKLQARNPADNEELDRIEKELEHLYERIEELSQKIEENRDKLSKLNSNGELYKYISVEKEKLINKRKEEHKKDLEYQEDLLKNTSNNKNKSLLDNAIYQIVLKAILSYIRNFVKNKELLNWSPKNYIINSDAFYEQIFDNLRTTFDGIVKTKLVDIINWDTLLAYGEGTANFFETLSIGYFRDIFGETTIKDLVQPMNNHNFFAETIVEALSELFNLLNKEIPFSAIYGIRAKQSRLYDVTRRDFSLEVAAKHLLALQREENKDKIAFINQQLIAFEIVKTKPQTCKNYFERGEEALIRCELVDGSLGKIELNLEPNKDEAKWTNICDLGLGISQLIPIIIQIAYDLDKSNVIFIEEPGIHLHPKYQSTLADFFAQVINRPKNHLKLAIETHSEAFIRKLQYLVSSRDSSLKPNQVGIYYIYNEDSKPLDRKQVEFIQVKKNGHFDCPEKFGKRFIDENARWIEKQKENEFKQKLEAVTKKDAPTLFVEGTTDKQILDLAWEHFSTKPIPLKILTAANGRGGVTWIEDMLVGWLADRKRNKVAALVDFDGLEKGKDRNKSNIEESLRTSYKKRFKKDKIQIFSLYEYKHSYLEDLFTERVKIQIGLEEMYDIFIWEWLSNQNLLEDFPLKKILIEDVRMLKEKGMKEEGEALNLYVKSLKNKDENGENVDNKMKVVNYIKALGIDEQKKALIHFKPMIKDLEDFFSNNN